MPFLYIFIFLGVHLGFHYFLLPTFGRPKERAIILTHCN